MQIECGWCSYCSSFCNFENWCFWNAHWLIILKVVTIMEVHLSRFVQVINWTLFQVTGHVWVEPKTLVYIVLARAWEICSDHNGALGNLHGLQKEDIIPLYGWRCWLSFDKFLQTEESQIYFTFCQQHLCSVNWAMGEWRARERTLDDPASGTE